jgi:nucleotide-binding universal stress UspA family protein
MKTIVTLLDLSEVTPTVMEHTERMAKTLHAKVVLMHVLPEDKAPSKTLQGPASRQGKRDESIEADYRHLSSLADYLRQTRVKVEVEQLVDADSRLTVDECEEWKPDLIIVGSKSGSPLSGWIKGSRDDTAETSAHCPVVVIPDRHESQPNWDKWPFDSAA